MQQSNSGKFGGARRRLHRYLPFCTSSPGRSAKVAPGSWGEEAQGMYTSLSIRRGILQAFGS